MENPVVLSSIVSPSNGSLDPTHGTLSVIAANAAGGPLAGVVLTGSGTSTFSGTTDSTGCAIFADLPAGNYTVTPSAWRHGRHERQTSGHDRTSASSAAAPSSSRSSTTRPGRWNRIRLQGRQHRHLPPRPGRLDRGLQQRKRDLTAKTYGTPGGTPGRDGQGRHPLPVQSQVHGLRRRLRSQQPDPEETSRREPRRWPSSTCSPPPRPPQIQLPALDLTVTNERQPDQRRPGHDHRHQQRLQVPGQRRQARLHDERERPAERLRAEPVVDPGLPWGTYKICASARSSSPARIPPHRKQHGRGRNPDHRHGAHVASPGPARSAAPRPAPPAHDRRDEDRRRARHHAGRSCWSGSPPGWSCWWR